MKKLHKSGQADTEIEITPEMIFAGSLQICEGLGDPEWVAEQVYRAMSALRPLPKPQHS